MITRSFRQIGAFLVLISLLVATSAPAAALQESSITSASIPPAELSLSGQWQGRSWVSGVTPPQLPVGGSSDAPQAALLQANAPAGYTFSYQLLKQTVALWADGRGDVVLERRLQNVDISNWSAISWYFDWASGDYSAIRAWDDQGPLAFYTSRSGTRTYINVSFRQAVQPGQSYHFYLAITIGYMASGSGSNWQAAWYTSPAAAIQEFIQGLTLPSNAVIQSVSPLPSTQSLNYVEWRHTNTPANWVDNISVAYTLSSSVGVPLLLQTSSPWATDTYGNYPAGDTVNTIRQWGCFMTSAAMITNYWGQRGQPSFQTDPRQLNSWLRSHSGYDRDNGVVHCSVYAYASQNGVSMYYRGAQAGRNDSVLDNYLTSGNPVIIGVNLKTDPLSGRVYPGHYVVATGKAVVGDQPTYTINDPVYGQTTLAEKWSGEYSNITLFSGTLADARNLCISAHSPVELLVTDALGRKAGYEAATSTYWNDIPESAYFLDSLAADDGAAGEPPLVKVLVINGVTDGAYTVTVQRTGEGT